MTIDGNHITAADGKALISRYDDGIAMATEVFLSANDSADNYIEIDFGEEHIVMKYSTLSIKRELAKLGAWDAAKALLTTSGYWDDYVLANYLKDTDEAFIAACSALVAQGIVTQNQLDSLLPLCVWTAD